MIEIIRSRLLTDAGFAAHGFTTRAGGVSQGPYASLNLAHDVGDDPSAVFENLARLRRAIDVDAPLLRVRQVHGARAASCAALLETGADGWTAAPTVEADAVVCAGRAAVLAVQVADCAPVLVVDPRSGAAAVIHAGWRGTARGVVRTAVRQLIGGGAAARSLLVAIGPCICPSCYEVGQEVARRLPESADPIRGRPGKFALDLAHAVAVSLIAEGLTDANIDRCGACSRCDERLFSHRGTGGDRCGRTLGFVATRGAAAT
jgi:YfiH family protein